MGNDIFGVKWRSWKLHFKEQDSAFDELRTFTMPRVYNLLSDPQERDNVLFPNTWVPKAALVELKEHVLSLKKYPPIPTAPWILTSRHSDRDGGHIQAVQGSVYGEFAYYYFSQG